MTAANHMLMGIAITLVIKQPVLVLPLAFMSHFVLDSLPHFGYVGGGGFGVSLRNPMTYVIEGLDLLGVIVLAVTLNWSWLIAAAAFLAICPDFHWLTRYFVYENRGLATPPSRFADFHSRIQRYERPWGIFAEVGFFLVGYYLLVSYLI